MLSYCVTAWCHFMYPSVRGVWSEFEFSLRVISSISMRVRRKIHIRGSTRFEADSENGHMTCKWMLALVSARTVL